MKNCKICNAKTNIGFNINFDLVPICHSCSKAIFIQQAAWYTDHASLTGTVEIRIEAESLIGMLKKNNTKL